MRRLTEEGGNDLELLLLRSAKHDGPAPHARRRTLVALGLGGTLLATSTTTAAASTTGLALIKWLGVAAVGTALFAGGYQVASSSHDAAPAPTVARGAAQRTAHAAQIVGVKIVQSRAMALAEERAAEEPAPSAPEPPEPPKEQPRPKAQAVVPAVAPVGDLAGETAALAKIQKSVESGEDPAKALAQLDKYNKKFGGGMLGEEAELLRIEAVAQKGDSDRVAALASDFLSKHPHSAHAPRVRTLAAQQQKSPE